MGSLEKVTTDEALRSGTPTSASGSAQTNPSRTSSSRRSTARDQPHVRERRARARHDPRRRRPGRGRHAEHPHDQGDPAAPAGEAPAVIEVRGEVYMPLSRLQRAERAPRRDEAEADAEPAQRRRGDPAAEGLHDHRGPPALDLGLRRRGSRGRRARDAVGMLEWLREHGFPTNPFAERFESIDEVAARASSGRSAGRSSTTRSTGS